MGSIGNGRSVSVVGIQMPPVESKTALEPGALPVTTSPVPRWPRLGVIMVATRAATLVMALLSVSLMVSSKQRGILTIFGIEIPLYANWSFSYSLQFLVGMSSASAAYSLAHLLLIAHKALKKVSMVPSRRRTWLLFAGDQVFALAMMSAGSAAAAVSNLNRTGIQHTPLPNFCKPLPRFCDLSAVSIACAFLCCVFLATSAVIDVIWLSSL
ncbi:CASP-like protein 3A1 [Dichanthelium oligosanthes]|uniref:CASP-like protein n=1 Tax=Dichanthelium oligosanthes TaxID=888268 RepID=A0A1E5VP02_9POAL|nr:CASP-like protein 3A1 [Dichanthelium oligosanthes]